RVAVEGYVLDLVPLRDGRTESLQGLVLRRGGEREIAGVRQHLPRLHQAVDGVLDRFLFLLSAIRGERDVHLRCGPAALTGMGLVDDDCKGSPEMLVADLVEDEGELLDRRDDDLLAGLQEGP